jgi:hypothetical protein
MPIVLFEFGSLDILLSENFSIFFEVYDLKPSFRKHFKLLVTPLG